MRRRRPRSRSRSKCLRHRVAQAQRLVAGQQRGAAARGMGRQQPVAGPGCRRRRAHRRARRAATVDGGCGSASRASATRRRWPWLSVRTGACRAGVARPAATARRRSRRRRACARAACRGSAALRPTVRSSFSALACRCRAGGAATPAPAWRSGTAVAQHRPRGRRRQTGQQAQQAGLAAPVAAAQPDHAPRPQRQLQRAKQRPLAALTAERGSRERRRPRIGARGDVGTGRQGGWRIHFSGGAEAARWGLDSVDGRGSRQQSCETGKKTAREGLARLELSLSSRVLP